jgi:hypothetical protein
MQWNRALVPVEVIQMQPALPDAFPVSPFPNQASLAPPPESMTPHSPAPASPLFDGTEQRGSDWGSIGQWRWVTRDRQHGCVQGDVRCQTLGEVGLEDSESLEGWCGAGQEKGSVLLVRNGLILIEMRDARGEAVLVEGVNRRGGVIRDRFAGSTPAEPAAVDSGLWEWQQVPRPAGAIRLLGCVGVLGNVAEDDVVVCEDEGGAALQRVHSATRGFAGGIWIAIETADGAGRVEGLGKGQVSRVSADSFGSNEQSLLGNAVSAWPRRWGD